MQVVNFNVIGVFLIGIPRPSHESDDISGIYRLPLCQIFRKWVILLQMGIVIVPLSVMAADAHTPATVLIPA